MNEKLSNYITEKLLKNYVKNALNIRLFSFFPRREMNLMGIYDLKLQEVRTIKKSILLENRAILLIYFAQPAKYPNSKDNPT